jgi:outer membrane biosynthesis protein TonB
MSGGGKGLKLALGGGLLVLGLAVAIYFVVMALSGKSEKPRKAPKIALMTPPAPPPPPPPPPKFEKKPDPPKEQKEMKTEAPVPKQEPAPTPELKMDGPAGDGPSAFAAGRVTNEDLSKIGTGKGTGTGVGGEKTGLFNPYNNYANLLKGEMQRQLARNESLRKRRYQVEARVWVTASGGLQRFELVGSTGDTDTDEAVQQALAALPGFTQGPPADMPQPIRLRIVTRG